MQPISLIGPVHMVLLLMLELVMAAGSTTPGLGNQPESPPLFPMRDHSIPLFPSLSALVNVSIGDCGREEALRSLSYKEIIEDQMAPVKSLQVILGMPGIGESYKKVLFLPLVDKRKPRF